VSIEVRQSPPDTYEIVELCDIRESVWCLVSCERSVGGGLEWHGLDVVLSWSAEETPPSLPLSIQQTHRTEIEALNKKVASLEEEVSGSKQVFDTYRERARVSLQKTASEQQEVEKLLAKAKEECKVQSKRADEAIKRVGHLETEHSLAVESLRASLEAEQLVAKKKADELEAAKKELVTLII